MSTVEVANAQAATIHPAAAAIEPTIDGQQRRVGLWFGVTGLILMALMALIGLVMLLNQGDVIAMSDGWFYRIMTLHASGMLAAVLLSMMGGLWYVVRSTVPGLDGRVASATYMSLMLGVVLVLVAVVFGGFGGAWTFLYPLPFASAGEWSLWATVLFLIGMTCVSTAFMIYCIDMLKSVTERYGGLAGALGIRWLRGRTSEPPPPQIIAAAAVAIQGIITSVAGTTIMGALFGRAIDDGAVIDALWAKNVTYFFGHAVANLIIYLAAGMIYVLVPLYAGRKWKTTKVLVVGWMGTIVFVMTAYFHHLYMDFVQPSALPVIGLIASSAAAIPVAVVTIYTGMILIWGSRFRWTLTSVFLFLGFIGWAFGGAGAVLDSLIPVNFRFHNTLWVPAHFHSYLLMGVGMWVIALVSYLLERASGRTATKRVAMWGPGLIVFGGYGFMWVLFITGALGVPRRWSVHPDGTAWWSVLASVFVVVLLVGLGIVLWEFVQMARLALARRGAGTSARAPAAPSSVTTTTSDGFRPMVLTFHGLVVMVAMGVASLFVMYPKIIEMSEGNTKYHHLTHAVQFFAGGMLGAAAASAPAFLRRFPGGIGTALVLVVLAPLAMLIVMIPVIYTNLDSNAAAHIAYHVAMIVFGLLTGVAAARLGRVAGWTVLWASIAMAVLFAAGVSGGVT